MNMNAQNAGECTGFHSVGMRWFRMTAHGIVIYAENVKTGGNGIAKNAINVHME